MGLELLYGSGTAIVGVLMLIPILGVYLLSQRAIERGIFRRSSDWLTFLAVRQNPFFADEFRLSSKS